MSIKKLALEYDAGLRMLHLGENAIDTFGEELKRILGHARRAAVITDASVASTAAKDVVEKLTEADFIVEDFSIPFGRTYRTFEYAASVMDRMSKVGLTNRDCVIGVGGVNVLDVASFIASVYSGGTEYAVVPTTLEAMVVVGDRFKLLDLPSKEGGIGAQQTPYYICCDTEYLKSLGLKEKANGFAYMVQAGFASSEEFYKGLSKKRTSIAKAHGEDFIDALEEAIDIRTRCARNERRSNPDLRLSSLDFGVTFANALEYTLEKGVLTSGELLAEGMRFESLIATDLGNLDQEDALELNTLLDNFRLKTPNVIAVTIDDLLDGLHETRPRRTKKYYFSLPTKPGNTSIVAVEPSMFVDHLDAYARSRELLMPEEKRPSVIAKKEALRNTTDEDEDE